MGVRVVRRPGLPSLVPDQPVEGLGLEGKEVGNLKVFGDPAEGDPAGSESARRLTGLRRAGSCQDASFRGPVVQTGRFACSLTTSDVEEPMKRHLTPKVKSEDSAN